MTLQLATYAVAVVVPVVIIVSLARLAASIAALERDRDELVDPGLVKR